MTPRFGSRRSRSKTRWASRLEVEHLDEGGPNVAQVKADRVWLAVGTEVDRKARVDEALHLMGGAVVGDHVVLGAVGDKPWTGSGGVGELAGQGVRIVAIARNADTTCQWEFGARPPLEGEQAALAEAEQHDVLRADAVRLDLGEEVIEAGAAPNDPWAMVGRHVVPAEALEPWVGGIGEEVGYPWQLHELWHPMKTRCAIAAPMEDDHRLAGGVGWRREVAA